MVADYTCLWWGSDNEMYDNRCGVEAQVNRKRLLTKKSTLCLRRQNSIFYS